MPGDDPHVASNYFIVLPGPPFAICASCSSVLFLSVSSSRHTRRLSLLLLLLLLLLLNSFRAHVPGRGNKEGTYVD